MDELLEIENAKKGSKEAFSKLIQKYEHSMYTIARARLGNIEDVNDVIQDTILDIYLHLNKLKDITKFKSWMTTILINNCNKWYIKNGKDKENLSYDELDENNIQIREDEIENLSFFEIISFLDIEEKTIITMYYLDEYTTREISEILGINESTLRSRISNIRNKIKKVIGEEE